MVVQMQAIVLAGGFGTRLRARVSDLPKPMAPVAGRPFLEYVLDRLVASGVSQVSLATGYLSETIEQHFGCAYRGMPLRYSRERVPLGTGGAVLQALRGLPHGTTLVLNGDTWLDVDLATFFAWCLKMPQSPGVVLREVPQTGRFGVVALDGERIVNFGEKCSSGRGWINAGVYGLSLAQLEPFDLPASFSLEIDLFQKHAAALQMRGYPTRGDFIDIGVPEEFDRAQIELPRWQAL